MATNRAGARRQPGSVELPGALHRSLTRYWPGVACAAPWVLPLALAVLLAWESGSRRILGASFDELWVLLVALGGCTIVLVTRARGLPMAPVMFLALEAAVACLLTDIVVFAGQPVRDFLIYTRAGGSFLHGGPVYIQGPLHAYPANLGALPFLYPPPTLPFAALLAIPPKPVAAVAWLALSVAAVAVALRAYGLSWPWAVAALAWPPVFQGLYVGNVAVPEAALFALGPRLGWTLVVGPLLKPQDAVPALWLVRERRWRRLALGLVVVCVLAIATLPLTGVARWPEWVNALEAYRRSQSVIPSLYGFSLSHLLPYGVYVLVALGAVAIALSVRGRRGLAALGMASAVVSPVLWAHGFIVAAPALLMLDAPLLWTAVGMTSLLNGPGWQMVMVAGALPLAVAAARHEPGEGWHPLGAAAGPWPESAGPRDAGPAPDGDEGQTATTLRKSTSSQTTARTAAAPPAKTLMRRRSRAT